MATESTTPPITSTTRTIVLVALVACGAALVIATANELSRDRIIENERLRQLALLRTVVSSLPEPEALTAIEISKETIATANGAPDTTYAMTLNDQIVAYVYAVTAPDGYNGPIQLLVGIYPDGVISGVTVVRHRETPGLGDLIERRKSAWLDQFSDKQLDTSTQWAVDRDGGDFDSLTGATITPRAVVAAVERTLQYHRQTELTSSD